MIKRFILCASAVLLFGGTQALAQSVSPHAIGLRFGGLSGFGGEISYQQMIGGNNRLELDLGLRNGRNHSGFNLAGIYQWVMPIEGGFNWFIGPGVEVGSWAYRDDFPGPYENSGFYIGLAGQIGIEYNFNIPLMISLDWRPSFYFFNAYGGGNGFYGDGIALGLRYQF